MTIRLALVALAVEAAFGIGFGVLSGLRRGGWFDATALLASLAVIAVPVFVLGSWRSSCSASDGASHR